ncbi:MAG TPA: hypothetical protein VIH99_08285 [Bdellovibrionota bacterium]|jgi:mevalonate kinase
MNELQAYGKCILAGEHSVVRGGEAIALPLLSRSFRLSWERRSEPKFELNEGPFSAPWRDSLSCALEKSGFTLPSPGYSLRIESDIPVQAGLGSSAALATAVVRFLEMEGAQLHDRFSLAMEIENLFHGKSSGLDVACVLESAPIFYVKGTPASPLSLTWKPELFLFDTGKRSSTKDCVLRVEEARRPDLDRRMSQAVRQAKAALASTAPGCLAELAESLAAAGSCFAEWGLGADQKTMELLKTKGALAVKPTGSGGGGFLLTLWKDAPPAGLGLIPVWAGSSANL